MYSKERISKILELLKENKYVTIAYLVRKLRTSESSIRRDLVELEALNLIQRHRGSAELILTQNLNIPFAMRLHENSTRKVILAKKAAALIKEGDVFFLDSSTSAFYLLQEVIQKRGITVITNSIEALHLLSRYSIKTIALGGTINPENPVTLVGDDTVKKIEEYRADYAFFSAQALTGDGVLLDCYQTELPVIRKMCAQSNCRVCLCDSDKIGKRSTFKLGTLADIDMLISDASLEDLYAEAFPNLKF